MGRAENLISRMRSSTVILASCLVAFVLFEVVVGQCSVECPARSKCVTDADGVSECVCKKKAQRMNAEGTACLKNTCDNFPEICKENESCTSVTFVRKGKAKTKNYCACNEGFVKPGKRCYLTAGDEMLGETVA